MTAFIFSFMLSHSTPVYPKPMNPGVCQTYAACVRQLHEINGKAKGGQRMGPRK